MLLDRSFRLAFASFSTLFVVVAAVTLPAQIGLAAAFRDEITVRNLTPDIRTFPEHRQVHRVGRAQLAEYRFAYWSLTALEILLLPLFAGAARRVIEVDGSGAVATAPDAWAHSLGRAKMAAPADAAPLVVAAAVSVAVGVLCRQIGMLLVEPISPSAAYLGVGAAEGLARAAAAPFFLAAWTCSARGPAAEDAPEPR